jgi:AAA domain
VDIVTVVGRSPRRDEPAARGALLVEVIGPAASGKTTLMRSLCESRQGVRAGMGLGKLAHVRSSLRTFGMLVPLWARLHRDDRWLDRREMRSIARLETWSWALAHGHVPAAEAIVLDHGPLYRLARLRAFGPSLTTSEPFLAWWRRAHRFWIDSLDLVVLLDAPDPVLLERVDRRGHWYLSAETDAAAKADFLDRYRRAFEDVLEPASSSTSLLRFRTDDRTTEEIAGEVVATIASSADAEVAR